MLGSQSVEMKRSVLPQFVCRLSGTASRESREQRCSFVRSQHGVCLARSFVGAGLDLVAFLTGAKVGDRLCGESCGRPGSHVRVETVPCGAPVCLTEPACVSVVLTASGLQGRILTRPSTPSRYAVGSPGVEAADSPSTYRTVGS
jgi:hypothetical protein